MAGPPKLDTWVSGEGYDAYAGRWSRRVADTFVRWLGVPPGRSWLDVGCGTGAVISLILMFLRPAMVVGLDPSRAFLSLSNRHLNDNRVHLVAGTGQELPFHDGTFGAVVAGLSLNFMPDPGAGVAEMARATRPGGTVAAYVWDYAGAMEIMRAFWDAAISLDVRAHALDEGRRFPICHPEPLAALFQNAHLHEIDSRCIDVRTRFLSFEDYWTPFLAGQGPAPTYVSLIDDELRAALRERLRAILPIEADGSIELVARAWAIRGIR